MTIFGFRLRRDTVLYFLLAGAGAGIMAAGLIWLLLQDLYRQKDDIHEEARHSSEFRARLMGDHATRTLEAVDLILFSAAGDIRQTGSIPPPLQIRQRLHERLLFLPQAVTLAIYDANGNLVADAKQLSAEENVANQAFFKRHRDEGALFQVEGPLPRRFDTSSREALRLSRLISATDGRFLGVLLAEIDPGFFRSFYREEDPLGDELVALLDLNGRIMASEQPSLMPSGTHISQVAKLSGLAISTKNLGGLKHLETDAVLATFYQVANFPIRVVVTIDKEALFIPWRKSVSETRLVIAGIVLTYLGALIIIGFLLQRRSVAEDALRSSEAHLRAMHDCIDIGIVQIRPDGGIQSANPFFAKMLGAKQEDIVGMNILDITHPDDYLVSKTRMQEMRDGIKDRYRLEKRYRRLDTDAFAWARVSAVTVRNGGSTTPLVFAMIEDIGEAKRAQETIEALLRRSQLLLSAVGEGILGLDASGRVAFINPAAEALLGYTSPEAIGKRSHALLHHHHLDGSQHEDAQCPVHGVLSTGKPGQITQDAFWRKDGSMLPVEYVATPMISESGIEGAVIAFRDVSRRMETESEIMRSNAELEQFAYAVSHDLQEPLRMVASYVQLLGRRYQGKLDQDADDFINFAVDGAKRMQQMITDLLEYSRVQRKGNPMAPVALDAPLQEALKNLELSIEETKATVSLEAQMPSVTADSAQMARLFQNLIGNAIKYRDKDRPLVIRIDAEREGALWKISVTDNGIGIDPQYFERIFQIFQRLHARTDYPGTGIGLAICRRIVERHGGKIGVMSAPGAGSTFFFTLPAA